MFEKRAANRCGIKQIYFSHVAKISDENADRTGRKEQAYDWTKVGR
jgi:hypothetical protein